MWTKSRVKSLKEAAYEAQRRIVELFEKCQLQPASPSRSWAWGQFLDESRYNTQYGIYGTSAGLQIFRLAGQPPDSQVVEGARRLLDHVLVEDTKFRQKGDLSNVFKVANIVEGISATGSEEQLAQELLKKLMIPGQGWGYYSSEESQDPRPNVTTTAFALYSLRGDKKFSGSQDAGEIVKGLSNRILQNGNVSIYEIALTVLALKHYRSVGEQFRSYGTAMARCNKKLAEWSKDRKGRFQHAELHHYATMWKGESCNKYMFFLPDCLVALALIGSNQSANCKRYVLDVVSGLTDQIRDQGSYTPGSRPRPSSVDHLWIYRLLQEFREACTDELLPGLAAYWADLGTISKLVLSLAFACLAGIGGVVVWTEESVLYKVVGGLVASIGGGLLVRAIWHSFLQRWWEGQSRKRGTDA